MDIHDPCMKCALMQRYQAVLLQHDHCIRSAIFSRALHHQQQQQQQHYKDPQSSFYAIGCPPLAPRPARAAALRQKIACRPSCIKVCNVPVRVLKRLHAGLLSEVATQKGTCNTPHDSTLQFAAMPCHDANAPWECIEE